MELTESEKATDAASPPFASLLKGTPSVEELIVLLKAD